MGKPNNSTSTHTTPHMKLSVFLLSSLHLTSAFNTASIAAPHASSHSVGRFRLPVMVGRESSSISMVATMPDQPIISAVPAAPSTSVTLVDSTMRSAVKAGTWRLVAALITMTNALVFSDSGMLALSIVAMDFATKSVTMFLGERLWSKVSWGTSSSGESANRSLVKAIAWRIFAAANTLVSALVLAKTIGIGGALATAGKIASSDTIVKTAIFYQFERIWTTISWGRIEKPVV